MNCLGESPGNRKCWNCWYDEFCDWHPAGDDEVCVNWMPEKKNDGKKVAK